MSSDGEFEQFIQSADAFGEPTVDDAQRVKADLSSSVSWKRNLPVTLSSALRTRADAGPTRHKGRSRFINLAALAISVAGLVTTTYTIVTVPGRPIEPNAALSDTAANATPPRPAGGSEPAPGTDEGRGLSTDPLPAPTMNDPTKSRAARSVPSSAKKAHRPSSLDAEVALLAETNAALQAKRPSRALALVDRHAREFPRGVLNPEFDAQRVLALSALHRNDEACALASRFLSSTPNSPPLAPQVRSSCNE